MNRHTRPPYRGGLLFAWMALAAGVCGGQSSAPQPPAAQPSAIVLPDRIVAGERATLAVLDAEGHLVSGAAVEIAGGGRVTTDATGRALFAAPAQPGTLTMRLPNGPAFSTAVISAPAARGSAAAADGATRILFPHVLALGDRFAVQGTGFGGDAQLDHIQLGDQEALVLAASSVALAAVPSPRTALGNTQMVLRVAGLRMAQLSVTVVSLDVSGPTRALAAGEKSTLTIGVNGTTERVNVELRNLSPEVVALPRSTVVTVTTSGGAPNAAKVELTGVNPGDYAVSAHVVLDAAGLQ